MHLAHRAYLDCRTVTIESSAKELGDPPQGRDSLRRGLAPDVERINADQAASV